MCAVVCLCVCDAFIYLFIPILWSFKQKGAWGCAKILFGEIFWISFRCNGGGLQSGFWLLPFVVSVSFFLGGLTKKNNKKKMVGIVEILLHAVILFEIPN